jgi:parallel beta-helix repeat protein
MSNSLGAVLYVGGSGEGNYSGIQDAIDNASDGDTVFVYDDSAPYHENILINKSITLTGENKETTVIDGTNTGTVLTITSDYVLISSFTIQNSGDQVDTYGIHTTSNQTVIRNTIIQNNNIGIYQEYTSDNIIQDNVIAHNYWHGIFLFSGHNHTIENNSISDNGETGIVLHFLRNTTIHQNIITNSRDGLYLCYYCTQDTISNNTITHHSNIGIIISKCEHETFNYNHLENNKYGLLTTLSDNHLFFKNTFKKNILGTFFYLSDNNTIIHNNYHRNLLNAFFQDCHNTWGHNYWNRPRLLPKPIFGIIHIPEFQNSHVNIDWRPALLPN